METCQNIWRPVCKGASGSNPRQATAVYADMEVSRNSSFTTLEAHTLHTQTETNSITSKLHSFLFITVPAMLPLSRNQAMWTLGLDETKIWCWKFLIDPQFLVGWKLTFWLQALRDFLVSVTKRVLFPGLWYVV